MPEVHTFTKRFLFTFSFLSGFLAQVGGITSRDNVRFQGTDYGPSVNFSATILKNGEKFVWRCIENKEEYDGSKLQMKKSANEEFKNVDIEGDLLWCGGARVSHSECAVRRGEITWFRDRGAIYRCEHTPNFQQTIFWLGSDVPKVRNVTLSRIAAYYDDEPVRLYCYLEVSPDKISFHDIASVEWEHRNERKSTFYTVNRNGGYKPVTPPTGSNFSLEIKDFNALNYGGEYRCKVTLKNSRVRESPIFTLHAQADVQLTNNLRDTSFTFGVGENAIITCGVDSYPKVKDLQLKISKHTFKVTKDLTSVSVIRHTAKIELYNISASLNGTTVSCEAFTDRKGGIEHTVEYPIIITNDPPPIIIDTNGGNEENTSGETALAGWKIALFVVIPLAVILVLIGLCWWCCCRKDPYDDDDDDHGGYIRPSEQKAADV